MAREEYCRQYYKACIQMNDRDYILWLPSWYPNEEEPFNGDFIQRHARAAAGYNRITVIFFSQFGETIKSEAKIVEKRHDLLQEIIVHVPFKPSGFRALDRIMYNISFYRYAKKYLETHFTQRGLPSLVHVHVPIKSGNLALWIKKKYGIPFIVSEHASTYVKEAPHNFYQRHWLYRLQVKKIFSDAIAVTNVSHAVGNILASLFAIKKPEVIHNVVDTSLFCYAAREMETFTYIHVSTLNEQKNVFGILNTFRRLADQRKDWRLVVVGPYTEKIERFILTEGLSELVSLAGEVSYAQVAQHMQQANVMVLFSRHENFPCVVVEALCCGLPVVSSDVAGIGEAVNHSNGLLVESENENALLASLVSIREAYPAFNCASIAADAKNKFGFTVIGKQFADLYKKFGTG